MNVISFLDNLDWSEDGEIVETAVPKRILADVEVQKYSNEQFRARYRFTKDAFTSLFSLFKEDDFFHKRQHSVPPTIQFLATLRFFATGNFQRSNGDLLELDQGTICRIVNKVSRIIAQKKSTFIKFPTSSEYASIKQGFYDIAHFPSVLGAIDCTHIPIKSPGGDNAEVFRNRKGYFSINVQAICDFRRVFTNIVTRWPGSTHDTRIFENSAIRDFFEEQDFNGVLLGDSGYPCRSYMMTPIGDPTCPQERKYNRSHIATRVRIEQAFGVMKQRFRALSIPLRCHLDNALPIIIAIACLHNYAVLTKQEDITVDIAQSFADVSHTGAPHGSSAGRSVRHQIVVNYF